MREKNRVMLRHLVIILILFSALTIFSINASANPVAVRTDPVDLALETMLMLFVINLPVNTLAYIVMVLVLYMRYKNDRSKFIMSTKFFISRIVLVSFLATIVGTIIDACFVIKTSPPFLPGIVVALLLIFISFFALALLIQKLKLSEALIIGLWLVVFNIFFWYGIFSGIATYDVILFIYIGTIITLIIVAILFGIWYWLNRRTIFPIDARMPEIDTATFWFGWLCVFLFILLVVFGPIVNVNMHRHQSDYHDYLFALSMSAWNQTSGTYNISAYVISTSPSSGGKWQYITWQLYNVTSESVVIQQHGFSHIDIDGDGYLEAGDRVMVEIPAASTYRVRAITGGSQIYESRQINILLSC